MSSTPLIEFQDVSFTYRPGQSVPVRRARPASHHSVQDREGTEAHPALRNVTLRIADGEYLAILGHNGSGKSTLARHCNALLTPDSGCVFVAGVDTREPGNRRPIRDTVGMVFQNPDNQIIATVVEDDIAWSLAMRGMPSTLITERVDWAMEAVGVAELRGLPPHRLSGGQRQRVAIAGVLALRPRCIVADELTSLLDPLSRVEITALLHHLNRKYGATIVRITHLVEEAVPADRVMVMEDGRIVLEGRPVEIFSDLEQLRRLSLAIPEPLELSSRLRTAGIPISPEALTMEAIAQEIAG